MKKKIVTFTLIGVMVFALTACGGDTKILGKWRITEVNAGDIVMTQEEIGEMGMDAGYLKLNKSGSCELCILEDEFEGSWTMSEDTITVKYGEELTGTATVNGDVMTLTDTEGSVYTLNK